MLAMKTIRGAGWLIFSRLLGRLIDVFTLLILARILTPADFGITALATSLIVIVDTVLEIPVTQALIRLKGLDRSHLDTGFTLGMLRSLLSAAVILMAAWPFALLYNDYRLIPLVAVLAIGPIARGLYSPSMVHFVREMNFRQAFIAELAGKSCAVIVAIATVIWGGGYWAIAANSVVAALVTTIASYVLAPYRPSLSLSRLADFSSFIGWFVSAQAVAALNWQFDRVLLGRFVDRATLGQYTVARDLAVFPTQSLIGPAMPPVMAAFSKFDSDHGRLKRAFLKTARFAMLLSAPACIGISCTADLIVAILLGPKWHDAALFLQLLALTVLTVPYFQTLYSLSLAIDRPIVLFKLNSIDLGLRIPLITIGLYLFSAVGVIIARGLLAAIMFVFYVLYARQLAGASVFAQLKNIWKVALAAAVMAASVLLLRHVLAPLELKAIIELVITAAVGAAFYVGTLLGCGVRLLVAPGRLELQDRWW
ncbi:lipopolysaccharide biosynthesis protein [Bosea sp. 2RAB26]|uniref:lipopolysaccharide biosynthesis protein n=1 Tax=Bosea sp. 2RAB26 TaxID=3237476 RepID=UPI003F92B0D4